MMNEYHQIIAIENTSGRNDKEEGLRDLLALEHGRWIIERTYNPFITYGITPPRPDDIDAGGVQLEFKPTLLTPLLDRLASRELTGNAAQREVWEVMTCLNRNGRDLLYRIMSKDLKCGIGLSTISKVAPGVIPVFAVMRAQEYKERHVKAWPMKGEYKLDGQRNTFLCKNGEGRFFTRSGNPVESLDFMVPTIMKVAHAATRTDLASIILPDDDNRPSFMLDGEAMMGLFSGTGALRRKTADAVGAELHLYDIMSYADFDAVGSVGAPLRERREHLSAFVRLAKEILTGDEEEMIQIVPQYFINSHAEVERLFKRARSKTLASYLARGDKAREAELLKTTIDKATGKPKVLEGVMIKNPDGLYDKKKSRGWLKMKAEDTEDLRVIGAYPGEPGTKYESCLGGVIVDREGVEVRVGGGFSDEERRVLWQQWTDFIAPKGVSELLRPAKRGSGHVVVADASSDAPSKTLWGRLIEIEFHEVTPDGSLRHPRFVRFRDDKDGEVESKEAA